MSLSTFQISPYSNDVQFDLTHLPYPSILRCHNQKASNFNDKSSTHFGFVLAGKVNLQTTHLKSIELTQGCYFTVGDDLKIIGDGKVVVFSRLGYIGLTQFGGPIESFGRLMYIDTCSTTILSHPPRMGDPCLHQLLFPPKLVQTPHIHPTKRFGVVSSGSGYCHMQDQKFELNKGDVFVIPRATLHGFESLNHGLEVISYHPDSNVGPTDEMHPMKSATYIRK